MPNVLCVGQSVHDFVFTVDTMPAHAEKYRASKFQSVGGGPAASAAVTITRLGGNARLVSRLGQDAIGDLIVDELQSYGVDTDLVRRFPNCQSSLSAVLIDRVGERLIVNYLDPELPGSADWLPDQLPEGVDAVLADSRWREAARAMLALAKAAHLPAVLDADQLGVMDSKVFSAATHIAFSQEGLADYAGHRMFDRALLEIEAEFGIWCCVTLGGDGVLYIDDGQVTRLPAYPVNAVDTLGAGDVWHGCFVYALAQGDREPDAIRFATAAAAIKVGRPGGRAATPTRTEVEHFLLGK